VIGPEGIKMEEEKMKGVLDWPTPKYVKDVQKFLELANYYHRFIKGFTSIARPLYDMVKKDQKCVMGCFGQEQFLFLFFFYFLTL